MSSTDSTENQPAGEILADRYELLEPIGYGGMSTVYRALDRALNRQVAVKVISHDAREDGDTVQLRERFRREAANAASIPPHPNVVQIYDYGTDADGDRDFIVMELLRGRDLKAVLQQKRFSVDEAVRILLEAARGLAAGHRAGIVHRDVKPANILLSDAEAGGTVRILDFGIAKALEGEADDDLTQAGGIPHTPAYASPEQRAGARLTPASDVYQLALLSYELLAGERAFSPGDRERIARGERVPLPTNVNWSRLPAPLRAVTERCLQIDPGERFPDAATFATALADAWESDQTLMAPQQADDETILASPGSDPSPPTGKIFAAQKRGAGARDLWRALPLAARAAAIGLIAILLVWMLLPTREGGDPTTDRPLVDAPNLAELEEDFAPLIAEAAERLAEEANE